MVFCTSNEVGQETKAEKPNMSLGITECKTKPRKDNYEVY